MGSRTSETLSEIEAIRHRLGANLTELEVRLPPLVRKGKNVVRWVGGGVGSGVALFAARKLVSAARRAPKKKAAAAAIAAAPTVVVRSAIGLPAALAVAAIWAGVRIYEIRARAEGSEGARGALRPLPGRKHA